MMPPRWSRSSIIFPSVSALHHQFISIHKLHLLQSISSPSRPHHSLPFQGTVAPIRPLPYDDAEHGQICEDVPPAAEHAFASMHGPHASRKHEIRRVSPAYSNVFAAAVARSRQGAASWRYSWRKLLGCETRIDGMVLKRQIRCFGGREALFGCLNQRGRLFGAGSGFLLQEPFMAVSRQLLGQG